MHLRLAVAGFAQALHQVWVVPGVLSHDGALLPHKLPHKWRQVINGNAGFRAPFLGVRTATGVDQAPDQFLLFYVAVAGGDAGEMSVDIAQVGLQHRLVGMPCELRHERSGALIHVAASASQSVAQPTGEREARLRQVVQGDAGTPLQIEDAFFAVQALEVLGAFHAGVASKRSLSEVRQCFFVPDGGHAFRALVHS